MLFFGQTKKTKQTTKPQSPISRSENPFQRMDWADFCVRFEPQLHQLFRALPLSEDDCGRLVLPLIERLFMWQQLLPASECHHHCYPGGMIVHSLEAARDAAKIASYETVFEYDSAKQKYHQRERWIVASAVMMLIHDVGKVFDVDVSDERGNSWNACEESLFDCLVRQESREYFVVWRNTRQHKEHELRSIRLAYQVLLTPSLIRYLSSDPSVEILSAIEDAIVFGKGSLSDVLREAESRSITEDLQSRHRGLNRQFLQLPLPAISILDSIRTLLQEGLWEVNGSESFVFVTSEGVFLKVSSASILAINETTHIRGEKGVPTTIEGITKVLFEAGLLASRSNDESEALWAFLRLSEESGSVIRRHSPCLLFKSPFSLFDATTLPKSIPVRLDSLETEISVSLPSRTKKAHREQPVLREEIREVDNSFQTSPLTDVELQQVRVEPMTDDELKAFLPRLFDSVVDHWQRHSWLVSEILEEKQTQVVISSLALEQVLENFKISQQVAQIFAKLRKVEPKIEVDFCNHRILLMWSEK